MKFVITSEISFLIEAGTEEIAEKTATNYNETIRQSLKMPKEYNSPLAVESIGAVEAELK